MKEIKRTKRILKKIEALAITVADIDNKNVDKAIENAGWYSLACGIRDEDLTIELLKIIRRENLQHRVKRDKEKMISYVDFEEVI